MPIFSWVFLTEDARRFFQLTDFLPIGNWWCICDLPPNAKRRTMIMIQKADEFGRAIDIEMNQDE